MLIEISARAHVDNFAKKTGIQFWSEFDIPNECSTETVLIQIHLLMAAAKQGIIPMTSIG